MITQTSEQQGMIIRTERGLTLKGSRITLYDILDFLKLEYPPKLIRDKFNLSQEQIDGALSYLECYRDEVEAEYQEVLKTREEIRQYWEERNREYFARISAHSRAPGKEHLWKKLEEQKAKH